METLYSALASLCIGAIASGAIAWLIYRQSDNSVFLALALGLLVVGGARVGLAVHFRLRPPAGWPHGKSVDRVGMSYMLGAWAFALLVGALGFCTIMFSPDPGGHLVVASFIAGYTAAITGRNSASMPTVMGQNVLCLVPTAAAGILHGGTSYLASAALLLLLLYSAVEIGLALNRTAVRSLVNGERNGALAALLEEQNAVLRDRDRELASQNHLFGAALANMPHGLCMFDADRRLLVANDRYIELFGLPRERVFQNMPDRELIALALEYGHDAGHDLEDLVREYRSRCSGGENVMLSVLSDGRIVSLSFRSMADGGAVVISEDVTEQKRAEARIAHLATHDALTELPNRTLFRQKILDALSNRQHDSQLAVLCLDLDGFKNVNDSLGHAAGDTLLRMVAQRLQNAVEEQATVARLGGDEFAILVPHIEGPGTLDSLARQCVVSVAEPFEIDGKEVIIGTSIGIALATVGGADPDTLLKRADAAMYQAKDAGRGTYRIAKTVTGAPTLQRRRVDKELGQALLAGALELAFEPISPVGSKLEKRRPRARAEFAQRN